MKKLAWLCATLADVTSEELGRGSADAVVLPGGSCTDESSSSFLPLYIYIEWRHICQGAPGGLDPCTW